MPIIALTGQYGIFATHSLPSTASVYSLDTLSLVSYCTPVGNKKELDYSNGSMLNNFGGSKRRGGSRRHPSPFQDRENKLGSLSEFLD
jgi:hypothetical protein